MKKKIFFWLDADFTGFCVSYYLQKIIDAEFYAIIDVTNKTRTFFENQNLVNFKKIWFFHDNTLPMKTPDLKYLSSFEKNHKL